MVLFGALFSLFSANEKQGSIFNDCYFWHGFVFTSIFNVAVIYAIIKYPDWMWMYFAENSRNSLPELIYIFVFMYYIPYAFGYMFGRDLKRRALWLCIAFIMVMIATEAWIVYHLFDRYSVVGTREEFLTGSAVSLFSPQNPIGTVMNGSILLMILYYLVILVKYKRRKKALES